MNFPILIAIVLAAAIFSSETHPPATPVFSQITTYVAVPKVQDYTPQALASAIQARLTPEQAARLTNPLENDEEMRRWADLVTVTATRSRCYWSR